MSQPPLISIREVSLAFGDKSLFAGLTFGLGKGDRACLVGRNGCGKTTLLKLISGILEPDDGEVFILPGSKVAYLPQEPDLPSDMTALEYVMSSGAAAFEAEQMLDSLGMPYDRKLQSLSGGENRRISLAHTLVQQPEVLLLDEPTNHLDLPTIEWLEQYLNSFRGALILISHDRRFLSKTSNRILWLDRGSMRFHNRGYGDYETWSDAVMQEEQRQLEKLESKLKLEEHWLHRGVTARRKRNQGRLRKLMGMRKERTERIKRKTNNVKLGQLAADVGSKLVLDMDEINKSYDDKVIIEGFSTRILRGDRIGIIGPNGAGKTTLLRLMVDKEPHDSGQITHGKSIDITYFDQMRDSIDPRKTLWSNVCETGGNHVMVQGRQRHVMAYLKDFMFDESQIRGPAATLSGGERNRLALAKSLAMAGNVLVLDEPTNDLDIDTLDLLIEVLSDYEGTLLVVSHDRDFLNQLVTSVIAVEGDGEVQEYVGGYDEYLQQRIVPTKKVKAVPKPAQVTPKKQKPKGTSKRLSYNDKRDWETLPDRIAALEVEIIQLEKKLGDPDLYSKQPQEFSKVTDRLTEAKAELNKSEDRWLELDMIVSES